MFLLAPAVATSMNLVCPGVWAVTTATADTVWDIEDSKFVNTWVNQSKTSEGEVRVELRGTDGRLMIPGKKTDGWHGLSDVRVDGGLIQARMRLAPLDKPSVTIDASAGRIRIHGRTSSFLGVCRDQGAGGPS
jgi:hypothetical protein